MAKTTRKAAWLVAAMALLPCARANAAQDDPLTRRVRTDNATIAELIQRATEASPTFRQMIEGVNQSDSYVFIMNGRCPHNEAACFTSITATDAHRMLWVTVNVSRHDADWDMMGSIGHELRHTLEVIANPGVRSAAEQVFFYRSIGFHTHDGAIETLAAMDAGNDVRKEVRRFTKEHGR